MSQFDADAHVRKLTEEQVAGYKADTRAQEIAAKSAADREKDEAHVKELTAQIVSSRQRLSETAQNLLRVASSKHADPVIVERAVKDLNRFRGEPEVDAFFAEFDAAERKRMVQASIALLKLSGVVKKIGGE